MGEVMPALLDLFSIPWRAPGARRRARADVDWAARDARDATPEAGGAGRAAGAVRVTVDAARRRSRRDRAAAPTTTRVRARQRLHLARGLRRRRRRRQLLHDRLDGPGVVDRPRRRAGAAATRRVLVLDGDGNVLMNIGTLADDRACGAREPPPRRARQRALRVAPATSRRSRRASRSRRSRAPPATARSRASDASPTSHAALRAQLVERRARRFLLVEIAPESGTAGAAHPVHAARDDGARVAVRSRA